ncbi:multicopper oxidase [Aplosporella prunicola CBS 121167]|uniref:Multicopper oxidase n=1 Tax=Aplosporella prunicola CBS 121167 TaxID=1176127 RepID=A0A6A6BCH7_9PEZI|nr:multicopper oxidase [Aplosporella prunicola CBS 121167]KAF2141766.1 multicopper oxidase [Aplosporella prunicola CBS 121167]
MLMSFTAKSLVSGLAASSLWGGEQSSNGIPQGDAHISVPFQQIRRNGSSHLGTFDAPHLPTHIGDAPWDGIHSRDVSTMPNTGVIRKYDFSVSYADIAPDGVHKHGIVINGQYPGPLIEANWGDWIQVTVHNNLGDGDEGTTLHWHGLLQYQTEWMDGVPGVDSCPIPPGETFVYMFRADMYGTSVSYYSHRKKLYAGGAAGPMVIYGPPTADYDFDLGPILLSDWFHDEYYVLVEKVMTPSVEPLLPPQSNNNLINGFGIFDCADTTLPCDSGFNAAVFRFQSGKKYRLRLVNTGAEALQKFSIDGHTLTVIANDFIPINPYQTDSVTLAVGQRTDVIVEANSHSTDAVWMRANVGPGITNGGCSGNDPKRQEAVAIVFYEDADTSVQPTSSPNPDAALTYCGNDPLKDTTPLYPIRPDDNPEITAELQIQQLNNGTHNLWYFGGQSYRANYNEALLVQTVGGNLSYTEQSNVFNFGSNSSVRFVIYNRFPAPHPMHMHGHNMWVLAEGQGQWDGTVTNPDNPQRRDVHLLQPGSDENPTYIVVQIEQDNPGMWPFHCHIAWHVSAGLYLTMLERPDDVAKMQIPEENLRMCELWDAYTKRNVPDQIDSGLR